MLGCSESATLDDMFSPLEHKQKIYAKNRLAKRPRGVLVRRPREIAAADKILSQPGRPHSPDLAISKTIDGLLLSKKNPAGVLVDEGLELLEVRGDAAAFIRLPEGRASFHLLNLIPDTGLFLEIEKADSAGARQRTGRHPSPGAV